MKKNDHSSYDKPQGKDAKSISSSIKFSKVTTISNYQKEKASSMKQKTVDRLASYADTLDW